MIRRLWREFTGEIVAVGLAGLGVFLLVEQMHIRATALSLCRSLLAALSSAEEAIAQGLLYRLARITLSDAMGLIAIGLAISIVIWRVHWRIVRSEKLASPVCPRCGSRLHRVHRRTRDKLITWIAPLRRYRCASRACRWTGLRLRLEGSRMMAGGRSQPPMARGTRGMAAVGGASSTLKQSGGAHAGDQVPWTPPSGRSSGDNPTHHE
jgi:hypothetical protein